MKYLIQLTMFLLAIAVIGLLQFQLWFGESGHHNLIALTDEVTVQQDLMNRQREINRVLIEDVKDLKNGVEAIEEHARLDLGYIKPGETFVQMSTSHNVKLSSSDLTQEDVKYTELIPEPFISPE